MSRAYAALWVASGGIAALWLIGKACTFGEALIRDLGCHVIRQLFSDKGADR